MAKETAIQEVLAANERFYSALARADMDIMRELWAHDPATECVHPGWDRLRGWEEIEKSWGLIFQNQGPVPVKASEPLAHCRGDVAWVTCYENISVQTGPELQISQMVAINVFERVDGRWRMVIHHASPAPPSISQPRTWRTSLN